MAMVQNYVKSVLRVAVAQICNNLGWHAIQTTPMDLLVDILHRYLEELGRTSHRYCEQFGRAEPNLDDVGLAFKDIGIPVGELEDFVNNVEPVPFLHDIAKIPQNKSSNLQFPKPGSREVQHRPEWIDEHLPLLNPEAEDEERSTSPTSSTDGFTRKPCGFENLGLEMAPYGLKRPLDISVSSCGSFKRPRLYADDEGSPMREGVSVFMTLTGEISAVREGRGADAKTPKLYDEGRPSSTPSPEPGLLESESRKDVKKDIKKEDKSGKTKSKKDKGKLLKKKTGKKEKTSKDGNKKLKEKNKEGKEKKLTMKLTNIERGPDGKFKKVKSSSSKSKISKPKLTTFKPFLNKSKSTKSDKLIVSNNKVAKVKKKMQKLQRNTLLPPKFSKIKSPMPTKSPQKHASPLAQLASFYDKTALGKEKDKDAGAGGFSLLGGENHPPLSIKSELSEGFSGEDSPKRLVIDDNPEVHEKQEREGRMAALNDSIDSVIQKGLEEMEKKHEEFARSYHQTIEDVIRQGVESSVKNEPRDVYDFTDDDISPPATPATPEGLSASPLKKKPRRESSEMVGKRVRDKIKEKIKLKSKEAKPKLKSPKILRMLEGADSADERPKTPEMHSEQHEASVSFQAPAFRMLNQFPLMPYFGQIPQVPPALLPYPPPTIPPLPVQFQSHALPNMPMPPMGFYVRNPRPDSGNHRLSDPPLINNPQILPPVEIEREAETIEKTKIEFSEEVEKGKAKEHKREKKEKSKDTAIDGADGDDKSKNKKKKEKTRKEKKNSTDLVDGEKSQVKNKNKEKVSKTKDKSKKTDKEKKKREDKSKEDSSSASGIPKITFKLGNNSSTSEGTKIVLKLKLPKPNPISPSAVPLPVPVHLSSSSSTSTSKIVADLLAADHESDSSNSSVQPSLNPNYDTDSSVPSSECGSITPYSVASSPVAFSTATEEKSGRAEATSGCFLTDIAPIDDNLAAYSSASSPLHLGACCTLSDPSLAPDPFSDPRVIKSMTSRENTQSSDSISSPVPELPIVVPKSHPKPQSKVNPVPLPVKPVVPAAATTMASAAGTTSTSSATARTVITETVGTIIDDQGNKIWICPACTRPDDGSPMIGCDECDDWYHWVCVGIVVPPKEEENWFCSRCIVKKQGVQKKKRKKHRKDKTQI